MGTWSECKLWVPGLQFHSVTLDLRTDEGFHIRAERCFILEGSKGLCVVISSWHPRTGDWALLNSDWFFTHYLAVAGTSRKEEESQSQALWKWGTHDAAGG